ncbi:hypothetical protein TYRP_003885 [Tyrophagus putrescentiae]|nr:hypothetical protein TYRP_003885 [Tyrophagus putrescentiae]
MNISTLCCLSALLLAVASCLLQSAQGLRLRSRTKRASEAYRLPAGAKEIMMKDIKTSFKCEKDTDGCKIFHRCHTAHNAGGMIDRQQYSFICNEGSIFDQSTFTCTHTDDAIPCEASPMFFDLNKRIGKDEPFLTDADIDKARHARPEFRAKARK